MAAVRARVADELLLLIEDLRQPQRLLGAEAVETVGVALQLREVVEERRRHALGLGADRLDLRLTGAGTGHDPHRLFEIRSRFAVGRRLDPLGLGVREEPPEPGALVPR